MESYAGVDWAAEKHDVLVADAAGERLLAATFTHDEQGLRSLRAAGSLGGCAGGGRAAGRPAGGAAAGRGAAGAGPASQPGGGGRYRFRASGGKSDRFDAFVLRELARTDHHRFRVLRADLLSDQGAAGDDRGREDWSALTALVNQLRAGGAVLPGLLRRLARCDSQIFSRSARPEPADRVASGWRGCRRFARAAVLGPGKPQRWRSCRSAAGVVSAS